MQERLERLSLTWSASGRGLRWGGLVFDGVTLTRGGQAIAHVDRIRVDVSFLRAAWDPRGALRGIALEGVRADLDVEQLKQLRASAPRDAQDPAPSTAARPLPEVRVSDAKLSLRDQDGPLVRADVKALSLSPQAWQLELAALELGGASGERAEFEGLEASGPIQGRRPQLARGLVSSASLTWHRRGGAQEDGEAVDDKSAGLAARLVRLRSALRSSPAGGDRPAGAGTAAAPEQEGGGAARSLWTADARIDLHRTRVTDGSVTPPRTILEQLNLRVAAEGEAKLRVRGDGTTATGGTLLWDVHIVPGDAQLEGRVSLQDVPLELFTPVLPRLPYHGLDRTRIHANLAITGHGLENASVRGELSIADLGFASERLARAPVGPISFTARGQGTWTPARRELSALRGEVVVGETRFLAAGALAWPRDGYRVDLRVEMPKTRCNAVLDVFPAGLLDELSGIQLAGDVKARLDAHVDSAALDATKLDFDIDDKCKFLSLPEAMNVKRFSRPFVHRVLEPDGTMFEMETGPGTTPWTPIELISPFMIQAVVAHEDGRFFSHRGFAETEIGAALARNLKARAFKFGASTITMQLVKNVFLHRDKLLSRKVQEALIVWWLEQQVDKKWILELYLNVIEYGSSVYGIRNAALHYFGVLPIHLTPAQTAFLATILPSPKAYDEQYERGTITESTKTKVVKFLQHMRSRERIDDEALTYGLEELSHFRFYDPDQPPPEPPAPRGSAQAPPFALGPVDGWKTYDPTTPKAEDGSFGFGLP